MPLPRAASRSRAPLALLACALGAMALAGVPASAVAPAAFGPTGLDGGGLLDVVAFDPWTAGVVLAGGDNSGLFRSEDDGRTWTPANAGIGTLDGLRLATLAFSPTVPGTVYAGAGFEGSGGGLLVSTDDGRSWTLRSATPGFSAAPNSGVAEVPSPHPRSTGTLLQVDARGWLYAATFDDGVLRSADDGRTWTTLGLAGEHLRSLALDPADPDVLYVAAYGDGIWKTTTASGAGAFAPLTSSPAIVEDLAWVGGSLYAIGPAGLARSADGGATWQEVGAGQLPAGGTGPVTTTPTWFTVDGYTACGNTTLYVGGQFKGAASLMGSADGGATWSALLGPAAVHPEVGGPGGPVWWLAGNAMATAGGTNYLATSIATDPRSATDGCHRERILVSGRAGLIGSTDGGANWYPMVRGLGLTVIRDLATDPNDPSRVYVAPADWGFVSTADGGQTFRRNAPGGVFDAFGVAVDPSTAPSTVYLATGRFASNTGDVWSSSDPYGGATWTNEGLGAAGGTRPTGLAVNRVGGGPVLLVATQGSGIWRKADGVWALVEPRIAGGSPTSFAWQQGSPLVFVYDHGTGVWRSTDAGQTWTRVWAQPSPSEMTGFVASDPLDPSRLYVSVDGLGVFRLDGADAGVVGGGIVPVPIGPSGAAGPIATRIDGALAAVELPGPAGPGAVLSSTDRGATWEVVSNAAYAATGGFARVLAVGVDGSLWAGLYGDGLTTMPRPTFDLVVGTTGTGTGRVTSEPAGIACPSTCAATVGWRQVVTLRADPSSGSTFAGWSGGGCAGTGACSVTVTGSTQVTATFTASHRPDALLATASGPFVGDGRYGSDGAGQTVAASVGQRRTTTFRVVVQNDGTGSERFAVAATRPSAGFGVRYRQGSTDVTSRVLAGSYRTPALAPGASVALTLLVTAPLGSRGRVQTYRVTASVPGIPSALDVVVARVTVV